MPRGKTQFRHEVQWAPDSPDVNTTYGARVQGIGIKRGKVTVTWSIFKKYSKKGAKRGPKIKSAQA